MSAFPAGGLDLQEKIARIRRSLTQMQRRVAEQTKLNAEQMKLTGEADKFRCERFLAPVVTAAAMAGAVRTLLSSIKGGTWRWRSRPCQLGTHVP